MGRPKNPIPKPRKHSSGNARVTIDGHVYYLGPYGSPQAEEAYRRIIAQWLAREGPFNPKDADPVTIQEVLAGYITFAQKFYGISPANKWNGSWTNIKEVVGIVNRLYASQPAEQFGPLDLKAVIGEMVRKGWCRSHVNAQLSRVKSIFKWAAAEQLLPASVWHTLLTVPGLKRGRSEAPESEPVRPVSIDDVEKTKPFLRPALRAMVDFCLLTGCRPNEACRLRRREIDQSNPACWVFNPAEHKTAHHGHKRLVLIGPRAQAVIAPYIDCQPDDYLFSPRREEEKRLATRRAARKSPMTPSQQLRGERSRRRIRARRPQERYTTGSMRRAIGRACEQAKVDVWGPNRLRHTRATELREHGLDVVATVLGHAKIETTQIYSEKNLKAAMELVARVG